MAVLDGNEVVSAMALSVAQAIQAGIIDPENEIKMLLKDTAPQEAELPAAFFETKKVSHENLSAGYANWTFEITVHCHPKQGQQNIESWARKLGTKLLDILNEIEVQGYVTKARSLEFSLNFDVLELEAEYSFKVKKYDDTEEYLMETLYYNDRAKWQFY